MEFDFFAESSKEFYNKFSAKSILVQGRHRKVPPFVSIILTTYKRSDLLRQALESAINQKEFGDYQIIVVDNEGEPLSKETETSCLLKEYCNEEKVIYYRHEMTVEFRMDYAARLARSPWICFLHDDDLLAENHLKNMVETIKRNPQIRFLSCPQTHFTEDISEEKRKKMIKSKSGSYMIVRYPKTCFCIGHYGSWQGALINRECYINIGGMPSNADGNGDVEMVGKFIYHFDVYEMKSETALYFYREWKGQLTGQNLSKRIQINLNLFYYYQYVIRKYHKFFIRFWDRAMAYSVINTTLKVTPRENVIKDMRELVESYTRYSKRGGQFDMFIHFKLLGIYAILHPPKVVCTKSYLC